MRTCIRHLAVVFAISFVAFSVLSAGAAQSQSADLSALGAKVRKQLVTLPYYGIFDNLSFRIEGSEITLLGQVQWPNLKNAAQQIVAQMEGVTSVENQIEVLPNSFFDNRIRRAVAGAIYSHPVLDRYTLQVVPSIHIIVNRGNVTLEGVVAREMHKAVANLQANAVAGVLTVTNNLRLEKDKSEEKS